jgi:hypothetical protein
MEKINQPLLSNAELLELQRWNTPTIYNGWEQITKLDAGISCRKSAQWWGMP